MKILFLVLLFFSSQIITGQINLNKIDRDSYSITYPSTLRINENNAGIEFVIFAQRDNADDDFSENINLLIQNLENMNIDLNKFVDITKDQILNVGILIESKRIIKGNSEYQRLVYKANLNNRDLKFIQYDFVKEEKAYVLTFTSDLEEFDNYSTEMENVMKSFVLK